MFPVHEIDRLDTFIYLQRLTGLADGKYYVTVTAYDTTYSSTNDDIGTIINENQTNGNESWYAEEKTATIAMDNTPPTVVATIPVSGATGVAVNTAISATFSEAMNASTIDTSTFTLSGGVTGSVSYNDATKTAAFIPSADLSYLTTYTATITTGVTDIAGNNMAADYTWSFTTAKSMCRAESIAAAPNKLTVRKNGNGSVTITVKGAGGCPVEGVTVTATINGKGKRLISVLPGTQNTDASGQAIFTINAKDKKGTAVLRFKATGLDEVATAQVKVR